MSFIGGFYMNVIRFTQKYRPEGKEYEKIFIWNRFLRKKSELIIIFAPTLICIISIAMGYFSPIFTPAYIFFILYPLLAYLQFKATIKKHLRNRKAKDNAYCEVNIMDNGILLINNEHDIRELHKWEDIKKVYDRFGYYLIYGDKKMLALLKKDNFPDFSDIKAIFASHNMVAI